ncbi:MAG: hypothetical protein ACM3XP_02415 [Nitrososphaerales archaeon]
MVLNNEFHSVFIEDIINCNQSIRWVGITDHDGTIRNERVREGLKLLLTKEEINEFAKNSIIRHKARLKFESKMGKLVYVFRRYENMSRCIIPINENYYLFFTMDFEESNFDNIIMEKIIPLIQKEKRNL